MRYAFVLSGSSDPLPSSHKCVEIDAFDARSVDAFGGGARRAEGVAGNEAIPPEAR